MANPLTKLTFSNTEIRKSSINTLKLLPAAIVKAETIMQNQETPQQKARRLAMNAWIRCLGLSKKSQLLVRQKVKEMELKECKKTFGVQYMDLVENNASDDALQACIDQAIIQVSEITKAIVEIKIAIDRLADETRSKIVDDPSAPRPTTSAAEPVVDSPNNEEFVVVDK
jgi:hypothetical protein